MDGEVSLIKRLRSMAASGWNPIGNEAANRIEELETALAAPLAGAEAVVKIVVHEGRVAAWELLAALPDGAHALYAAPQPDARDAARLDALEDFVRANNGIVLHNGGTHGNYAGLGLGNTNRTLRQAIDQMAGFDAALAGPRP